MTYRRLIIPPSRRKVDLALLTAQARFGSLISEVLWINSPKRVTISDFVHVSILASLAMPLTLHLMSINHPNVLNQIRIAIDCKDVPEATI